MDIFEESDEQNLAKQCSVPNNNHNSFLSSQFNNKSTRKIQKKNQKTKSIGFQLNPSDLVKENQNSALVQQQTIKNEEQKKKLDSNNLVSQQFYFQKKKPVQKNKQPFQQKELQRYVTSYHSKQILNCLRRLDQQQKSKTEFKEEEISEKIKIDKNLSIFPVINMTLQTYNSKQHLINFMLDHEKELLKHIQQQYSQTGHEQMCQNFYKKKQQQSKVQLDAYQNKQKQKSIKLSKNKGDLKQDIGFVSKYEQIKKLGPSGNVFLVFKCTEEGCNAMLKVSTIATGLQVYVVRSQHTHTIFGVPVTIQKYSKRIPQNLLEEDLHKKFGLRKGTYSETRDVDSKNFNLSSLLKQQKDTPRSDLNNKTGTQEVAFLLGCRQPQRGNRQRLLEKQGVNFRPQLNLLDLPLSLTTLSERLNYEFEQIVKKFTLNGIRCFFTERCFLFSMPKMQEQFKLFPQTVKFHSLKVAFKFSRKRYPDVEFAAAVFAGVDNKIQPAIYAIGIYDTRYTNQLVFCFEKLMEKEPVRYICYRNAAIQLGFQPKVKKEFLKRESNKEKNEVDEQARLVRQYMYDPNETFRYNKPLLRNPSHSEHLRRLICTSDRKEFDCVKQWLLNRGEAFAISSLCSKSIISNCVGFVGLSIWGRESIDALKSELTNNQIYSVQEAIITLSKASEAVLTVRQAKGPALDCLHRDPQLRSLKQQVSARILNLFYQQYCKALQQSSTFQFQNAQSFNDLSQPHADLQGCSCNFTSFFGIPCSHLLKVAIVQKKSYLSLFDSRYILSRCYQQKKIK